MTTILENIFLCLLCTVHVLAVIFSINPKRVGGGGPSTPPPQEPLWSCKGATDHLFNN